MKTLKQLLTSTPLDVKKRADKVIVTGVSAKSGYKKDIQVMQFVVRCHAHSDTVMYDVLIDLYPNEVHTNVFQKPDEQCGAWVKCSCPFFLFNCEYALAHVGSSEIDYSNGKKPVVTNPRLTPMLCKHLVKAAPVVIKAAQESARKDQRQYKFV